MGTYSDNNCMTSHTLTFIRPKNRSLLAALLLFILAVGAVFPQVTYFRQSFALLRHIDLIYVVLSMLLLGMTFLLAAGTLHFLARKKLLYHRTILVAMANMFTNRLVPAGAGTVATFYLYLRRQGHSRPRASAVLAVNNFLGFFSHATLFLVLLIVVPSGFSGFSIPHPNPYALVVGLLVVSCGTVFLTLKQSWHRQIRKLLKSIVRDVIYYGRQPYRLVGGFITSMVLTVTNAAILWCCVLAVGSSVSFLAGLMIFTVGVIAGTFTPTPGGIGGVEAGLLAALVAYHLAAGPALAAVILYRLLTYWSTFLIGSVTFVYISRRGYLRSPHSTV